ncbi:LAMI_0E04258g1_1 [Lachancea mirantina]|uniref:LAMI_0E04258g1_1 n=1 Tax=Lachancea mirantina TaxID=1230905 RepID=A0A1G4JK82_9SACH|nr:LAMI_0E04258g1_1 [Lachancea mirantina]
MITPQFKVIQDDEFIQISISISSIRFKPDGLEIVVDENLFIFHLAPYYLRLRFSHKLVDDERCKAEYKAKEEIILVRIAKETPGEQFEDLDLTTKLLARQNVLDTGATGETQKTKGPLIQEVDDSRDASGENLRETGEKYNWEIRQETPQDASGLLVSKYGFDDQYSGIIGVSIANGNDINELSDPESTSPEDRVCERLAKENEKFDPEYYISEYMTAKYGEQEELQINGIKELLSFIPPQVKKFLKWYKQTENKNDVMPVDFNETQQQQMANNIPKRQYLVTDGKTLYLTLVSLLFAYVFEQIENEGSHTTESAWTIGKLTPQIAFLDHNILRKEDIQIASVLRAIVVTGIRRSLSYTLHRNYDLSLKAWNYVYYLLRGGKRLVIQCLLDIHEVFRFHDVYYVYNRILIGDLCSWFISNGSENVIRSLAAELKKEVDSMTKDRIDFDCFTGIDEVNGIIERENMTLAEMEQLAESEYLRQDQPAI